MGSRYAVSIHGIGYCNQTVGDANSRTQAVQVEVIVDILLVLVEIVHEYLRGVCLLPIGVIPCVRDIQRVGFQIITDKLPWIILVKRSCYYQLPAQISGDDAVIERGLRLGGLTQVIDKYCRYILFRRGLNTDIRVAEIGSDRRMIELLRAAGAIDAVRTAVTDLRIGHFRIHVNQYQAIQCMVIVSIL